MLRALRTTSTMCDSLSRRDWLRVGGISLGGLALPQLLHSKATAGERPRSGSAKSVIVIFNTGGGPQHESWDPKPDGPTATRGDFTAIATRTPGLFLGELMPQTAQLTDKIAVVRTMVTGDNAHSTSGYQMLTGMPHIPLNRENAGPGKPNDWPAMNAIVQALRPSSGGLPSSIALPRRLANNGGQDPWPGTDAGILGRKHDPWLLVCDPSDPKFTVPGCELPVELSTVRVDRRLSLLESFNRHLDRVEQNASVTSYDRYQQQAIHLIAGGSARNAFNLSNEPDSVRDRYGRSKQGQSVLLARRLVEAGVSLVQVHWANADKAKPNSGGWDTHEKHSESLKGWLMPVLDQFYSALIEDLSQRGMLDETLVCLISEFGHTPKFNAKAGRDHWGRVFSIALAGGGIRGGVVHGSTDRNAAEPLTEPVRPADYLATAFHCLGYDPDTLVYDVENRPIPISRGQVISNVLA
ncbi:MAG: DUF1501 domain-containing protein [Planctomycetaceae bacterium]